MRALVWLFVIILASAPLAQADAPIAHAWVHIGDEDGISLWKQEVPGFPLPGFRGEVTIAASIVDIERTIRDAAHHTEWIYRCAESRVLEGIGPDEALLYNRTAAPWPVWDRDVVLETRVTRSVDGMTVLLSFHNAKNSHYPLPEHVVRMPRLVGFYKLVKLAPEQTKVTYQVEADPGGSLPRWLAARVARDLPYETLSRLRKRVARERS